MDTLERLVADPSSWVALATLIAMEVVLGVDNLVFIAILANRMDQSRRALACILGLSLALAFRLVLLAFAAEIIHLKEPLTTVFGHPFSARDPLLLAGGLFLVWRATGEIHERVDPDVEEESEHVAALESGSPPTRPAARCRSTPEPGSATSGENLTHGSRADGPESTFAGHCGSRRRTS